MFGGPLVSTVAFHAATDNLNPANQAIVKQLMNNRIPNNIYFNKYYDFNKYCVIIIFNKYYLLNTMIICLF